jgi:succinoglycan biosynthesis protein ExoM
MQDRKEHISICIATRNRNALLRKLLLSLLSQKTDGLFTFSIIVVDNDEEETARIVVEEIIKTSAISIRYYSQPIENISITRNLAVKKSTGDYIAFIDDDEYPSGDWLYHLYVTLKSYYCDIVHGPVFPYFEKNTSKWITKSGFFFYNSQYKTGADKYKLRGTGNVLIRKRLLDKYNNPFNPRYGLSGGEDAEFFKRIENEGARFCWSSDAYVHEYIFPERANILWIVKKAFSHGNSYILIKTEGKNIFYIIYNFFQSTLKLFVILFLFPIYVLLGIYHIKYLFVYLKKIFGFFGQISAYFNYKYFMYKQD